VSGIGIISVLGVFLVSEKKGAADIFPMLSGEKFSFSRFFFNGIVSAAVIYGLWFFLLYGWGSLLDVLNVPYSKEQEAVKFLQGSTKSVKLLFFVSVCIIAPLSEELLFRRFLYGVLYPFGFYPAFITASFAFGAIHFFLYGLPVLFLIGIMLQWSYCRSRNFAVPVVLHSVINGVSFVAVLAQQAV
jgi:membrane protease YdiL (CAAX protease family)